jgi:hypothetical protein
LSRAPKKVRNPRSKSDSLVEGTSDVSHYKPSGSRGVALMLRAVFCRLGLAGDVKIRGEPKRRPWERGQALRAGADAARVCQSMRAGRSWA